MDAEKKSKISAEIGIIKKPIKHKGHKGTRRSTCSFINLCVPGVLCVKEFRYKDYFIKSISFWFTSALASCCTQCVDFS